MSDCSSIGSGSPSWTDISESMSPPTRTSRTAFHLGGSGSKKVFTNNTDTTCSSNLKTNHLWASSDSVRYHGQYNSTIDDFYNVDHFGQPPRRLLVIDDSHSHDDVNSSNSTRTSSRPVHRTCSLSNSRNNVRDSRAENKKNKTFSNLHHTCTGSFGQPKHTWKSEPNVKTKVRTVSPEPSDQSFHRSKAQPSPKAATETATNKNYYQSYEEHNSSIETKVFVADSMRGNCYHRDRNCHGLRSAHGTCSISLKGALLRKMRACKICQPKSIDWQQKQQQQKQSTSSLHNLDGRYTCDQSTIPKTSFIYKKQSDGNRSIPYTQKQDKGLTVHIASSLKGKCYHTNSFCNGLRSAVGGSVTVSKKNALAMKMRPCKLCCKEKTYDSKSLFSAENNSDHATYTTAAYSSYQHTPPTKLDIYFFPSDIPTSTTSRSTPSLVGKKSTEWSPKYSCKNAYVKNVYSNNPLGDNGLNSRMRYYTTPTGKCYHTSLSCSSLRYSKNVKEQMEKPHGKRPCMKCCHSK